MGGMKLRHASPILALILLASACMPDWLEAPVLTADGADIYNATGDLDQLTVLAPAANKGGNLRLGLLHNGISPSTDQRSCATWQDETNRNAQEGALLRWDGQHGATVTKNVWGGAYWGFNVHTWDTKASPAFTQVAGFTVKAVVDQPLPWRLCAYATGQTVSFKVWPLSMPEPADGDPCCWRVAEGVPMPEQGRPGWYIGHLHPGESATFTDMTAEPW